MSALVVQFSTMWCGSMIYASQGPGNNEFVIFLSIFVIFTNVGMIILLIFRLVKELKNEFAKKTAADKIYKKAAEELVKENNGAAVKEKNKSSIIGAAKKFARRVSTYGRGQSYLRSRTFESADSRNSENPLDGIELPEISTEGEGEGVGSGGGGEMTIS